MIKRYLIILTALLFSITAIAQPTPGTYNWESSSTMLLATSNTSAPAVSVIGNGFTATTEGDGTGSSIRVLIGTSLSTNVLRFDRLGAPAFMTRAILASSNGGEFRLSQLTYWPIAPTATGIITMTARRNGTTIGSVQGSFEGASPLPKRTFDVSANSAFYNIDELWFTGVGVGFNLDDIVVANVILPVSILSFETKEHNKGIELNWQTAEERNNSHFEIRRSKDGINFETIATVDATANAQAINNYSYLDEAAPAGKSFYQLIQQDHDGRQTHLGVRVAERLSLRKATAVAKAGHLTVNMNQNISQPVAYTLTDMNGKTARQGSITTQSHTISITALSSGIYVLRLSTGEAIKFRKD